MKFRNYLIGLGVALSVTGPLATTGSGRSLEAKANSSATAEAEVGREFAFLDVHSSVIDKYVEEFNSRLNPDVKLTSDMVKAVILNESGSPLHRDNAYKVDPMQVADPGRFGSSGQGSYALEVLAKGEEHTDLIGDFSRLSGKGKTPRKKNGKVDYSNCDINAEESILAGIGWLFHKAAIYGERIDENESFSEYTVKEGDTGLWRIAKDNGTIVDNLRKHNNLGVDDVIHAGQTLKFTNSQKKTYISGWKSWDDAVKGFGNQTPEYFVKWGMNLDMLANDSGVKRKRIVLDPGHGVNSRSNGRYDPGAISGGHEEAAIVLNQAKKIKGMLEDKGYSVVLTRKDEFGVNYRNRDELAEYVGADLFVSLHCNGNDKESARGQEVYFRAGGDNESLATSVRDGLVSEISKTNPAYAKDRGVKTANFAVLKSQKIPSILVESGFISSKTDRAYLMDNINDVERGIVRGIENYFGGAK